MPGWQLRALTPPSNHYPCPLGSFMWGRIPLSAPNPPAWVPSLLGYLGTATVEGRYLDQFFFSIKPLYNHGFPKSDNVSPMMCCFYFSGISENTSPAAKHLWLHSFFLALQFCLLCASMLEWGSNLSPAHRPRNITASALVWLVQKKKIPSKNCNWL